MPKQKFYITTSIDYVNAKPHIGHALEKVQADALARFARLQNKDTYFLTGTDEHGAKIARAAEENKKPVEEFVDENAQAFKNLLEALNISNDHFVRTTDQKHHWPGVRKMWRELKRNGDIYKKEYEGLYCYGHEAFVTEKDLKDGECEIHGKAPEHVKEENYFFKLSKYTNRVKKAIQSGKLEILPKERENEILKLLEQEPEDVSFSRPRKDLKWGIPVPNDKTQTIYVWADALTNYLSALGWGTRSNTKFEKYWPADVHVIGKDILRFHAVIWPAMLMSVKLPLPKKLFVHGFINVEGQKMSKSLGNIVDPIKVVNEYSADALRYYILAEIPSHRDGDFSKEKFEARYNGDLALGLGNFLSRVVSLGEKYTDEPLKSGMRAQTKNEVTKRWKNYEKKMEEMKLNEAIKEAQSLVAFGDKRINDIKLWELAKNNPEKFKEDLRDLATLLAYAGWMLYPIIPEAVENIYKQLGIKMDSKERWQFKFKKGKHLFQKL